MKRIKVPAHQELVRPYFKDRKFKARVELGVQRLKVIDQIIRLREKLGLTQTELADRLDVSQPYVARIENDEASNLSLETLVKIAEALGGVVDIRIRTHKKAA